MSNYTRLLYPVLGVLLVPRTRVVNRRYHSMLRFGSSRHQANLCFKSCSIAWDYWVLLVVDPQIIVVNEITYYDSIDKPLVGKFTRRGNYSTFPGEHPHGVLALEPLKETNSVSLRPFDGEDFKQLIKPHNHFEE